MRQLSNEETWDKEFAESITGTPWSLDGEVNGDVNIRIDLPGPLSAWEDRGSYLPDVEPSMVPRSVRLT